MKRVAIIQSSYVPWKGYVDIIGSVDEFILYDDAQYTRRDWRNRNRIKTSQGTAWLTIPVRVKGRFEQPIREVEVADPLWASRHWRSVQVHYARARCFATVAPALSRLYGLAADERLLTRINELFLRGICELLGIGTRITRSMDYELHGDRTERLVNLCHQAGAREYLSGPAAKAYLDEGRFAERGIAVRWMDYSGYREYPQLFTPPFIHEVSILDLLLNQGPQGSRSYLLSTRGGTPGSAPRGEALRECASPS
jgi:hypothetical protein